MGTRGLMGVRIDGVDKLTYNHFDSYPGGLGDDIVKDINLLLKDPGIDGLRTLARELKLVDESSPPTPEEQARFKGFLDEGVGSRSAADWYCLLRNLQGRFSDTIKTGAMIDSHEFINDSLFCEWAYIVNLDTNTFEVYRGFQTAPHLQGRYSSARYSPPHRSSSYYPCALVAEFPLDNIPESWIQQVDPQEEE